MYKDMFTIFGYTVQTHAVVSLLAILLGYGVALGMTRGTQYYKHIQNFLIYGVLAAILGARLWHVFVFQWPYYSKNPGQIFAIWSGGISIEGAIVGGVIGLLIYCKVYKVDFLEFADYLAAPMILAQGIGRIAELLAGDVFGRPTGHAWGVVYPEGTIAHEYYGNQALWPADVWESQGNMILFAILFIIFMLAGKRLVNGWVFSFYVFLYYTERFLLEFIRGDSPRYALNLTGGQWSAIVMVFISIILMLYLLIRYGFLKKQGETK